MEDTSLCDIYCDPAYSPPVGSCKDIFSTNYTFYDNGATTTLSKPLCNCSDIVRSWVMTAPRLLGPRRLYAKDEQTQEPVVLAVESVAEETVNESAVIDSSLVKDGYDFQPTSIQLALAMAQVEKETGRERIQQMFSKTHTGHISEEVNFIWKTTLQTFYLSFAVRFIPAYKNAREDFIRENRATVFRTQYEANRRQRDYCFLKGAKEGWKFSRKITVFTFIFVAASQMMACYRNKTSHLEYVTAGATAGSILRCHMGLKGMTAGVVIGGVLGGLFGSVIVGMMRGFGFTQEERHLMSVMAHQELEKSIIGERAYHEKVKEVLGDNIDL